MRWDGTDGISDVTVAGVRAMNVKSSATSLLTEAAEGLTHADERSEHKPAAGAFCEYMDARAVKTLRVFQGHSTSIIYSVIGLIVSHFGRGPIIELIININFSITDVSSARHGIGFESLPWNILRTI